MPTPNLKQEAHRLIDQLPEDATWDDLMYQLYVRQAIESGLPNSNAGNTMDVKKIREMFDLTS